MNAISFGVSIAVLLASVAVKDTICADLESRCPRILRYEEQIDEDRWQAVLELKTREGSEGVWLIIGLNAKTDALIVSDGSSFKE